MSTSWKAGIPAPSDDDLNKCVACGLCLPDCPTFRVTGLETASPRGRIAAMRAVGEGRAPVAGDFTVMTDECLACRACEAACPSGVPFGRMIEAARAQTEAVRTGPGKARRRMITQVIGRPRMLRAAAWGLATAQLLRLDHLLPRGLRMATPRITFRDLRTPLPEAAGEGPVAMMLVGCVMDVAFRPVHQATARALVRAGYRVVVPDRGGCCGALAAHAGEIESARGLARASHSSKLPTSLWWTARDAVRTWPPMPNSWPTIPNGMRVPCSLRPAYAMQYRSTRQVHA